MLPDWRTDVAVRQPAEHEQRLLPCAGSCHGLTRHQVLAEVGYRSSTPPDPEDGYHLWRSVDCLIVNCLGCNTPSFCQETRDSEVLLAEDTPARQIYPPRIEGRPQMDSWYVLPMQVRAIYQETHAAICMPLPVLASIGLRAIVETVCRDKCAPGGNLQQRIDGLVKINLITDDGAKILHSLRVMGNGAAHEVKPHKADELGAAMEVVEHLLQGVYILPELVKKLPQPR
jgi:hypothetical protein